MAFTLPTFNLLCTVFTGAWPTVTARLTDVPCNLALGRRVQGGAQGAQVEGYFIPVPTLLVPPDTDIRDFSCAVQDSLIEVPQGSGRYYGILVVDDIGKGFDNEHRFVSLYKACESTDPAGFPGLFWPSPIP